MPGCQYAFDSTHPSLGKYSSSSQSSSLDSSFVFSAVPSVLFGCFSFQADGLKLVYRAPPPGLLCASPSPLPLRIPVKCLSFQPTPTPFSSPNLYMHGLLVGPLPTGLYFTLSNHFRWSDLLEFVVGGDGSGLPHRVKDGKRSLVPYFPHSCFDVLVCPARLTDLVAEVDKLIDVL